jgi:hypothetical protein
MTTETRASRARDPLNPMRLRDYRKNDIMPVFLGFRASVRHFAGSHAGLCREKRQR